MIRFACPNCKKIFQSPTEYIGRVIACTRCNQVIQIAQPDDRNTASPTLEVLPEENTEVIDNEPQKSSSSPESQKTPPQLPSSKTPPQLPQRPTNPTSTHLPPDQTSVSQEDLTISFAKIALAITLGILVGGCGFGCVGGGFVGYYYSVSSAKFVAYDGTLLDEKKKPVYPKETAISFAMVLTPLGTLAGIAVGCFAVFDDAMRRKKRKLRQLTDSASKGTSTDP